MAPTPQHVSTTFTISLECRKCPSREAHLHYDLPIVIVDEVPAVPEGGRGSLTIECANEACGQTVKFTDLPVEPEVTA